MKRYTLLYIIALAVASTASAQQTDGTSQLSAATSLASSMLTDSRQLWRNTDIAAGLSRDTMATRGQSFFEAYHREGSYHRVQEGAQTNTLRFLSERQQAVGKWIYAEGAFEFNMARINNRAWADVMRPYNSNPYFTGSNISGAYEQQDFSLRAKAATIPLGAFTAGLSMTYDLSDLSRLRDPRSRNMMLHYRIGPSATYKAKEHTVALAAYYDRRKEKLPSVTTIGEDLNFTYYMLSGMENANGSAGGYQSLERQWVDHSFGAIVGYDYNHKRLHSLTTASLQRGTEYTTQQYKYEPGRYLTAELKATTQNRIAFEKTTLHADAEFSLIQGRANEYKQQRVTTIDPQTGFSSYSYETLIEYPWRYQVNVVDALINCRLDFHQANTLKGYAGIKALWQDVENKHLTPDSRLHYSRATITAEGGLPVGPLWIEAKTAWSAKAKASLNLNNPTADYAQAVLIKDMAVYEANYAQARLQVTYEHNLKIKGAETRWFVKAYCDRLWASANMHTSVAGLSIGLFN